MSNRAFALLFAVLLLGVIVGTVGGCIKRYNDLAVFNQINSRV